MTKLIDFEVARAHLGDEITDDGTAPRQFEEGDTRRADPAVVAQLVRNGVLIDPNASKAKANDTPIENKAEGNAPENKAASKKKG